MDLPIAVLEVVGPVFLVALSGYVFAAIKPISLSGLTDALFYAFVPALVFSSLSRTQLSTTTLGQVAGAATLLCLGSGALAWLLLRVQGRSSGGFLLVSMFANNANMGMSLCALAFGETGLALAAAYYATAAILTFSLGLRIAAGQGGHREMLRVPLIYAALAGLLVKLLGISVPPLVGKGVDLLGAAAIPSMLFALGYRLHSVRTGALGLAAQAVVVRIGGGLALGLLVSELLGVSGVTRAVIVLQASMPAAVINFVIAEKYDRDPELVSSAIALGTLASLVSLPALLAWLMA